jgi:Protein of unknown function (DUF4244)
MPTETETETCSPTEAEAPAVHRERPDDDRGQTTSEYALVILVAAAIAFSVIGWARNTDAITSLFDHVIGRLTSN